MATDDFKGLKKRMSRRQFIKTVSAGAVTLGVTTMAPGFLRQAGAATRDHILIGQPAPLTGPLAAFGEPTMWMKAMAEREINKDGGIFIKSAGRKLPVRIKVVDTQSNPTVAAELASKLILGDKVDLMVAMHAPTTVDPVTSMCERYEMPCIALDSPLDSFIENAPHKWAFQAFWNVNEDILPVYTGMWEQIPTNKKVGLLFVSDPGAVPWSQAFNRALPQKGYTVIDKGLFPPGTMDFASHISAWKKEGVEIVTGNLAPPDWITCWRQCFQMGYKPKIATIGRAILFPSVLEAMGPELSLGLTTEIWWSPFHPYKSSRTGMTSRQLAQAWIEKMDKQWTQPLGYDYAGYELAEDVLRRAASLDKEALRQAIIQTDLNTMVGPIKYNAENYCRTPVVGGQWVKGGKYPFNMEVVYNKQYPQISETAKLTAL